MTRFDFNKLSILLISCFLKELTFSSQNGYFFQIVESSLEVWRVKEKFSDNPVLNIWAIFKNLVLVQIATNKKTLDIYSITNLVQKLPHELLNDFRLKVLGNVRKMSNLGENIV